MASRKRTPETSRIARSSTVAYSRKQKSSDDTVEESPVEAEKKPDEAKVDDKPEPGIDPTAKALLEAKEKSKRAQTEPTVETPRQRASTEVDPPVPDVAPWPDATPVPMKPIDTPPGRSHADTVAMPAQASLGQPPEMPVAAPPQADSRAVEQPTRMPGPREIPPGNPEDPAPPPGIVPRGDSRSLRRGSEFALIYRIQTYVISRTGVIGTRGQWRVVDYPTSSSAAHSYAKECSRFVSEGFSDYRE
jgi:hypothetical protein